jgi:hypothetical protein
MPSVAIRLHSDSLASASIDCASKAAATPFFFVLFAHRHEDDGSIIFLCFPLLRARRMRAV